MASHINRARVLTQLSGSYNLARVCLQTFANVFVFVFVFAVRRERRLQTGPVCKRLYVFVFANPTNKRQTLVPVPVPVPVHC